MEREEEVRRDQGRWERWELDLEEGVRLVWALEVPFKERQDRTEGLLCSEEESWQPFRRRSEGVELRRPFFRFG